MSPLKAAVLINDCINTISISVGKPSLGPSRKLNVYLEGEPCSMKSTKIGEYVATGLPNCYGVVRCEDSQLVPIATCATLAGCQAVALSDYLKWSGIELVSGEE